MSQPQTQPPGAVTQDDPGRVLGIVGLVLAIVGSLVGLILSAVAFNMSKKAGYNNKIAKAGIIVGIITTVLAIVFWVVYLAVLVPQMQQMGR